MSSPARDPRLRIRTLTAGVTLRDLDELAPVEATLAFLDHARRVVTAAGYEVQTIRVTLNPLLCDVSVAERQRGLRSLERLDGVVAEHGASLGIGPVFARGAADPSVAAWAADLARATRVTNFSVAVADAATGVHEAAVQVAGEVTAALAVAAPQGGANFRFAAAACIPAGTPFFPVGFSGAAPSLAIGLESANVVADAFAAARSPASATARLTAALNRELKPIEDLGRALATADRREFLGIDVSPAPGADCSIVAALEALTGRAFGAAATLQACAAVTAALRAVTVQTCGYSGLMLPVLEDPVLARRAAEGHVRLAELLLYSSVCGTGIDVAPVPGAARVDALAGIIADVATLAVRLKKPLSARLLPIPGLLAGDVVELADARLCASRVLPLPG